MQNHNKPWQFTDTGRRSAGLADGHTADPTCCCKILIVRA